MQNIIDKIKSNWILSILLILSVVFFCFYSYLAIHSPSQYNSPDEQSNYFFIEQYVERGEFTYVEMGNRIAKNAVHPRSTGVIGDYVVPGGFLGLIFMFGVTASVIGMWIVPFIIPFISAITPVFFYYVVMHIFGRNIGLLSSVLLFLHPAFWYFSARSLFPNILLVNLLIIMASCFIYANKREKSIGKSILLILGGLILGFSISIRLNEIIWIIPFVIIGALFWKPKFSLKEYLFVILGTGLGVFPVLLLNYTVYGSPFFTGYFEVNTMIAEATESTSSFVNAIMFIVLPFGFHIKNILKNLINYQLRVFSFLTPLIFITLGYLLLFWRKNSLKLKKYIYLYILIIAILVIYYGSWKFNDHPDPRAISIGTSYIRYWLPLYILSLPLISYVIIEIKKSLDAFGVAKFKSYSKNYSLYGIIFLVICFAFQSYGIVYSKTDESLKNVRKSIEIGVADANIVKSLVGENSIVITDYDDKYLFPDVSVMVPFRNDYNLLTIPNLLTEYDVYYFGITLPEIDMNHIHETMFNDNNVEMFEVQKIKKKSLYKFKMRNFWSTN